MRLDDVQDKDRDQVSFCEVDRLNFNAVDEGNPRDRKNEHVFISKLQVGLCQNQ